MNVLVLEGLELNGGGILVLKGEMLYVTADPERNLKIVYTVDGEKQGQIFKLSTFQNLRT